MDKDNKEREDEMAAILKDEPQTLTIMSDIRKIAQKAMKEKGLTLNDVKKTLGIKRYEK